jgi:hypothetical protein
MTILESQFEQVAGEIDAGEVLHYDYDVRFNVVMKERLETVPGKAYLTTILKTLKSVVKPGEVLELFDIETNQVQPDLSTVDAEELGSRFCVELGGKDGRVFMFGLKIQATIPYFVFKQRIDNPLKARSTYVSLHRGGFAHGVNWTPLGFFVGKHPKFANQDAIKFEVVNKFAYGWNNDANYWTDKKKKEIQKVMNTSATRFDPTTIPLVITSMSISSTVNQKTSRTYAVTITAPRQLSRACRTVMDYLLLHAQTLPQYVPLGLKTEDPNGFHNILKSHERWLDNHRNIQINNIPSAAHYLDHPSNSDGPTIAQMLNSIPDVLDVNYDPSHSRVNISVDKAHFPTLSNTLAQKFTQMTFEFQPTVRKIHTTSTISDQSVTTTTTKYSHILSDMISAANSRASSDEQTTPTLRSNPWKKTTVPSTIDFYTTSPDHFPPLTFRPAPAHTVITTATTAHPTTDSSSDTITATTLQSAILEALAEQQQKHNAELLAMREDYQSTVLRQHREELEIIRNTFQAEINSLRQELSQQRENHQPTNQHRLEEKIDLLMSHFCLNTLDQASTSSPPPATPSKSPHRKKSRNANSPPGQHAALGTEPTSETMDTDDPAALTALLISTYENKDVSSSLNGVVLRPSGSED